MRQAGPSGGGYDHPSEAQNQGGGGGGYYDRQPSNYQQNQR